VSYELGDVKTEGESATAQITMKFDNVPAEMKEMLPASIPAEMQLKQDGGDWCITGFGPGGGAAR
jgi:hypothetical protein